jgi:hypothetical protein
VAHSGGVTEAVSTITPLSLPLLISASLHRDDEVGLSQQAVALDFTLAPFLRILSLSHFRMSPAVFERVSFKHIINLTFDYVYDINPNVLIPQLPNLEEAAFRHATFSKAELYETIRHPKLRRLEVGAENADQMERFLPVLNLPRLESLSIFIGK